MVVIINFQNIKMRKEKAPCKSLLIIMLDSVVKVKKMYYPPNTLGGMQIWTIKDKNGEPYWWRFGKKFDESDNGSNGHESESDGHETESDGESNNKSLIVYANHALLGFYFCLTV